jgi:hypothetical protein
LKRKTTIQYINKLLLKMSNTNSTQEADSKQFAQIKIGDFEYRNVHDFNFEFTLPIDKENQPSGIPRGGKICVKLDADQSKSNPELLSWMLERQMKNGHIVIHDTTTSKEIMKIEFTDALCINYKQTMVDKLYDKGIVDPTSKKTFIEDIQITWRKLKWDPVVYENDWM